MKQYRCKKCGRRLFDHDIKKGEVEVKCPRCGEINKLKE